MCNKVLQKIANDYAFEVRKRQVLQKVAFTWADTFARMGQGLDDAGDRMVKAMGYTGEDEQLRELQRRRNVMTEKRNYHIRLQQAQEQMIRAKTPAERAAAQEQLKNIEAPDTDPNAKKWWGYIPGAAWLTEKISGKSRYKHGNAVPELAETLPKNQPQAQSTPQQPSGSVGGNNTPTNTGRRGWSSWRSRNKSTQTGGAPNSTPQQPGAPTNNTPASAKPATPARPQPQPTKPQPTNPQKPQQADANYWRNRRAQKRQLPARQPINFN